MNEELTLKLAEYVAHLLLHINCDGEKPEKPAEFSWETVYAFTKFHFLASGIYSSVEESVKAEATPELVAKWNKRRTSDLAQHIKQSAEFSKITAAFTEEKINFLPLKGFIYKSLWKNPAHRTMSDMDIYFYPDDFPRVDAVLRSLGYEQTYQGDVDDGYKKKPFVNIEAHKKFFRGGEPIPFDTWESKPDNPYWHIMSHEQFLLFGIEHAKKHYANGGCGMRVVFDFFLYMKRFESEIDRASLEAALKTGGFFDFFQSLSRLADYWFCGGCPDDATKLVAFYVATGGAYGSGDNVAVNTIKKRGRLRYVLSRLFPPYSIMKKRFPILHKLPILLPFAYILRFLISVFNGGSKREIRRIKRYNEVKRKESGE
jgi:hypothetical protein